MARWKMDMLIKWTNVLSVILLIMLYGIESVRVPEYIVDCGDTVRFTEPRFVGRVTLDSATMPESNCSITIETEEQYNLRYIVSGIQPCTSVWNGPVLKVLSNTLEWDRVFCEPANTRNSYIHIEANSIELEVNFENKLTLHDFQIVVEFYKVHDLPCESGEVFCNVCMRKDLACDPSGQYCDLPDVCMDIKPENTNTGMIAGGSILGAIVGIILVIICCWCHRRSLPCFKRSESEEQRETIAARARQIFTVQLASRGVDSNERGADNEAYTDDGERIDPSLAEPPPEYSSLENIDEIGKTYNDKTIDDKDGLPPSYQDAIENQDKYSVVDDSDINR